MAIKATDTGDRPGAISYYWLRYIMHISKHKIFKNKGENKNLPSIKIYNESFRINYEFGPQTKDHSTAHPLKFYETVFEHVSGY